MGWRHLIPLLFLASTALLGVLHVMGLLGLLTDPDVAMGAWHYLHTPAKMANAWIVAHLPEQMPGAHLLPFLYLSLAILQQVVFGYGLGLFFDLPWHKLHRKTEEGKEEDELHRDLKIAARVAERLEAEEAKKKALREKVERLKAKSKGGGEEDGLEAAG